MAEMAPATRKSPRRLSDCGAPVAAKGTAAGIWLQALGWADRARELAAIVEYSNDAVFSRKLDGTITTWNVAAQRIFGFKAEEVIGRKSDLILPRGHHDEFCQLLKRIRRGEVVEQFETERLRKDGRRIFVSLTLSPVREADGRLIGFSTIARDTTAERQAREALQRSERALADLFEEASVGLLWTTCSGDILRANRAALDVLECQAAKDCIGLPLAKLHPERPVLAGLLRRLAGREMLRSQQATLRARNGQMKEVLIDASAFWENGKIVHLRWWLRDITRRKQLEREVLAISERERSMFSRELHDSLGSQLSGITYLAKVLHDRLREARSPEAAEAEHISALLKQALEQVRAVARGLSPVRPEPEGLETALRELATKSSALLGIRCQFRCPKPLSIGNGEAANHLYRIAQEAVHNAFHHGQAKSIVIGLAQKQKRLRLRIVDNGKGIGTLSPRRKGLGLRIMQYRAGLLQGTVSVRRRRQGGTEVCCVSSAKALQIEARKS